MDPSHKLCSPSYANSDVDEENLIADADSHADGGSSNGETDSDADEENSNAKVDANTGGKDGKDLTPQAQAYFTTAGDDFRDVKIVTSIPWEILNRREPKNYHLLAYNCYYDVSKRYKDQDTGYYDLHFEAVHDRGGSFLNQLDSRCVVDASVVFGGELPNLQWARSFPAHVNSAVGLFSEDHQYVSLKKSIWKFLPEEIVFRILSWLSPAAQSRFRCVCSKWKAVLSNGMALLYHDVEGRRPFCTIKSNAKARHVSAYCHSENKWFDLPCTVAVRTLLVNPNNMPTRPIQATTATIRTDNQCDKESLLKVKLKWELADVEGELFCYTSKEGEKDEGGRVWVAVCNPMIPKSSLLLPPTSVTSCMFSSVKLLVDREHKTFKVVTLWLWYVQIFDSVSFEWVDLEHPLQWKFPRLQLFVQSGTLYSVADRSQLFRLDMVSRAWDEVEVQFPCTMGRDVAIKSSHDQVMVVEVNPREKEYVRVWKLLIDAANKLPLFSAESWEKQEIALPRSLQCLARHFRECWLSGSQFLFVNGGQTNQWIKYDFLRRTWGVMPSRGRRIARLEWFEWKPGFDKDLILN